MGTAMVTPDYVRLTPDLQSRQGAVWSRVVGPTRLGHIYAVTFAACLMVAFAAFQPLFLRDWELKVHFKIHGVGKKNFNGDGLALWLTKDRMQNGGWKKNV